MLADAIRAEGYRLSKNRTALFWSLLFVPVMAVVIGALSNVFLKANEAKLAAAVHGPPGLKLMLAGGPLDLGAVLVEAAGNLANPAVLLFVLIGAATIYAGDYRWESWRLISARNSRTNLLLGKLVTVAWLALAAMALFLAAGLVENLIKAGVFHRALTFSMEGKAVGQFFAYAGLSWLRVIQFTMMGLLAAVATRSLLAALFVPMVFGVAQFFSPQMLMPAGVLPDAWLSLLVNPGAGVDAIKAMIEGGPAAAALPAGLALKAWVSLGLWTAVPLVGAVAWFKGQDLSKE